MILFAVRKDHAHSRMEILKDEPNIGESGYHACKTLSKWYLDPSQKRLMLNDFIPQSSMLCTLMIILLPLSSSINSIYL